MKNYIKQWHIKQLHNVWPKILAILPTSKLETEWEYRGIGQWITEVAMFLYQIIAQPPLEITITGKKYLEM